MMKNWRVKFKNFLGNFPVHYAALSIYIIYPGFSGKMVFLRKLKLIYRTTSKHYNNCLAPTLFKCLAPPPLKKEGKDYAFYMRDYKGGTIVLLPFYVTEFLFTEL